MPFFTDLDACNGKVVPPPVAMDVQFPASVPPWLAGAYLYTDTGVGQSAPAMARSANRPQLLQGGIGWNGCSAILPASGSTTPQGWGAVLAAPVGTVSHPAQTSTNLLLSTRRTAVASASSANSSASLFTNHFLVWRGSSAGLGGFYLCSRFALQIDPGKRSFCGLYASTSGIGSTVNPSTLTNMIGVGTDAADTQLQLMHNDQSGTATKLTLGVAPVSGNSSPVYQLELFCPPNPSTVIYYRVINLSSMTLPISPGSFNTDIPQDTQFLAFTCHANTAALTSAATIQHVRTYIEADV